MSAPDTAVDQAERERDALVERLLQSTSGVFDIFALYIGDRLGLYQALVDHGPQTPAELASHTGNHERYVREWLEQQAASGILKVEEAEAEASHRTYSLPAGHAEVVAERNSLNYLAPLAQLVVGAVRPISSVLEAFRSGGGVPFGEYGADLREGQAGMNRASFLHLLAAEWLPAVPELDARLKADPPARVADVGCGGGWSSIGIAQGYPKVHVDGFDLDEPSVELARRNAAGEGLTNRVAFHAHDAGDPSLHGRYDLVCAFECVHDMSNPVGMLRAMRGLANDNGSVLVMDERVGHTFMGKEHDLDSMMYGWSILHCLPVGMADQPSSGTGTVMRPDTLRRYAKDAGFRDLEILPIDNYFFRFYRLHA